MADGTASGAPKRRVGRPRANAAISEDPSEDILNAAASLFCSAGYTATTTRQIADAAGLRQASLFHHFARKGDLLGALLDRTVEPALDFVAWLDTVDAEPAIALATLVRFDVVNLCSLPHNLGTLILLPESREPQFAPYWAKRDTLRDRYELLLTDAVGDGSLVVDDVTMATDLLFGLVESVITWFPRRSDLSAHAAAHAIAELTLRSLLPRRDRLASILQQSEALLLRAVDEGRARPAAPRPSR
jgi:AcrR family transcriptional regulator